MLQAARFLIAEKFFVFPIGGTRFPAALKHSTLDLRIDIGAVDDRLLVAIELAQFTIHGEDIVPDLGLESAMRTDIGMDGAQACTLRAFLWQPHAVSFG